MNLLLVLGLLVNPAMSSSEIPSSEIVEVVDEVDEEVLETEQELENKFEEFLDKYANKETVNLVVQWAINSGILSAFAIFLVKYRKVRNKTIGDIEELARKELNKVVKELAKGEFAEVFNFLSENKALQEKLLKAFVLSQDNSPSGKKALVELLAEGAGKEVQKLTEKIVEEVEKKEAIKEAVKADLTDEVEIKID